MIRNEMFETCKQAIYKKLGSLNDLPLELANTVANIFYKYLTSSVETSQSMDTQDNITRHQYNVYDTKRKILSFLIDPQNIRLDYDLVLDLVKDIRLCDKNKQPDVYNRMVDYSLFILKYHIRDVLKKSYVRLRIERYLARNTVQEIPNLIDLMNLKKSKKQPKRSRKKKSKASGYKDVKKKSKSRKAPLPSSRK